MSTILDSHLPTTSNAILTSVGFPDGPITSNIVSSNYEYEPPGGGTFAISFVSHAPINHSESITISGAQFGTKSTAPPVVWDRCTGSISANWDGRFPNSSPNTAHDLQYRDVGFRSGVGVPHSRATRYMVGAYSGSAFRPQGGANVQFSKNLGSTAEGSIYYCRTYFRNDPNWQFSPSGSLNNNHKLWNTNYNGNGPTQSKYWYIDFDSGSFNNPVNDMTHKTSPGQPEHALNNPDAAGEDNWWYSGKNPCSQWCLYELEARRSTGNSGYIKMWSNGKLVVDHTGRTDDSGSAGQSIAIGYGGYSGSYTLAPTNNFRYWTDIYADNTAARVMLCNNSNYNNATIREPQIPTAWADGSITCTVNLGALTSGNTAYLFVINAAGSVSSGWPVTVGS